MNMIMYNNKEVTQNKFIDIILFKKTIEEIRDIYFKLSY